MKVLYYFHGWNSAIAYPLKSSDRLKELMKFCKKYDYAFRPRNIDYKIPQQEINAIVSEIELSEPKDVILTGTSLGGWFARMVQLNCTYLIDENPNLHIDAVGFNPAINPGSSLRGETGKMHENYKTGKLVAWNNLDCDELDDAQFEVNYFDDMYPFAVFVDKDDEIIPYAESKEYHKYASFFHAFEGGNHRFQNTKEAMRYVHNLKLCVA